MNLKGEMSMLNVLHLEHTDVDAISAELRKKRDEMPQFFMQSPIVIDCSLLGDDAEDFDFLTFREVLLKLNFIPVGVRNNPVSMNDFLKKVGWAVMRETRKPTNDIQESNKTQQESNIEDSSALTRENTEQLANSGNEQVVEQNQSQDETSTERQIQSEINSVPKAHKSLTVVKPVRSGQQIYAAGSDMTVIAQTSAGSEIMADGSIHVYGALRGRVLAGALGNQSARIFCQSLHAELIAIAGRYQLLDESDTELIGKPAMIKLVGEKLVIEPLFV